MFGNKLSTIATGIAYLTLLSLCSCFEKDKDPAPDTVSDNLHFAFATPDWKRTIDCTHLDLNPHSVSNNNYAVSASSASTKNTFSLSYPKDSSDFVNPANLKKHPIKAFGETTTAPFLFGLKLPITEGGKYILSKGGQAAEMYNEIVSVKYVGAVGNEAKFRIKGRYRLVAADLNDSTITRPISGTYHFQIKTTRN